MIAITMGDPNGVGPEIILKAYLASALPKQCFVLGDISVLRYCSERLGLNVPLLVMENLNLRAGGLNVLDMKMMTPNEIEIGKISKRAGRASIEYVRKAANFAKEGLCSAMVTLPINKTAIMLSESNFIGHTELIAGICGVKDYVMMLASEKLIITHVSTHVSMLKAIRNVKRERIVKVIKLTHEAMIKLRGHAKIAVAGLNPHAGEGGAFGDEEIREIAPAIEEARNLGFDVYGPLPPDTIFFRILRGDFDGVVCMYHDQGHIAMKFSGVDDGVNVTLGLPIIRTSVDHGTAFDIAYQGVASIGSFVNACKMAEQLLQSI
jgi:4-hydroxythreonine-4-phosphate dehydrogenase